MPPRRAGADFPLGPDSEPNMTESLGILETTGLSPALVALDAMEKAAHVRVLQAEVNDFLGICIKIVGPTSDVAAAIETGRRTAAEMGGKPVTDVIHRPDPRAMTIINGPRERSPLIQQDVVWIPREPPPTEETKEDSAVANTPTYAIGLIETQGFTAVFEAIDSACKAANVEVVGKEKLGGGYITVIIKGDVAAVKAAVDAGKAKVEGLGKLIAAHVIARPSANVLSLLP